MTTDVADMVYVYTTAGIPAERRTESWQAHTSKALMGLRCRTHSAVVFCVLAGEAFFYHSAGMHVVRGGQLVVCQSDRPFMRGFSADFEELFMKIPNAVLLDLFGLMPLDVPLVADFGQGQNLFAASLVGMVAAATRVDGNRLADEGALLSLLGVPQYILGRRLAAANALLRRQEFESVGLAEVTRRCGFVSTSYFSRSFTARFGERATEVRRSAMAERANAPTESEIGHWCPNRTYAGS